MSVLKEKDLKSHIIGGNFKNFYVIYGDEKYLIRKYTDTLVSKIMGKNLTEFNYHTFNFLNLDLSGLQSAILIVPFMSELNCVVLEDINVDELNANDYNDLTLLLSDIPDTTVVIFTTPSLEQDFDKSTRFKKLTALADKNGICANIEKHTELSLEKDLVKWAGKLGSKLTPVNASKIIEYTTNDIEALRNEVKKLCDYADGQEISIDMIDMLVAKNLQAKVFALADNVIDGKADLAYKQLEILFYQREKPTAILSVIAGVYIDTYRAKIATENGVSMDTLAQDFEYKNRAFVLKKASARASKLSLSALRDSIDAITQTDVKLKSSVTDKNILLERLIAQLLLITSNERKGYR